jgi:uncharacterized membrane protein
MKRNGSATVEMRVARGLAWFSIGLGLAELLFPGTVARLAGLPRRRGLLRLMGVREIASGLSIFMQHRPSTAMWSRVAGDAVDLTFMAGSLASPNARPKRLATSMVAVAGVTALDVYAGRQISRNPDAHHGTEHVETSVTIERSREDLYAFWHNFEYLPRFMDHLKSVTVLPNNMSHWVAKGPGGTSVEWDAEIVAERPNELIAWRSVIGSSVDNSGSVKFDPAPGGRGTIVRLSMDYHPPAGKLGSMVAKLFGDAPEIQVPLSLRRFKQLMETGEILTTEGQPAGRTSSLSKIDKFIHK